MLKKSEYIGIYSNKVNFFSKKFSKNHNVSCSLTCRLTQPDSSGTFSVITGPRTDFSQFDSNTID